MAVAKDHREESRKARARQIHDALKRTNSCEHQTAWCCVTWLRYAWPLDQVTRPSDERKALLDGDESCRHDLGRVSAAGELASECRVDRFHDLEADGTGCRSGGTGEIDGIAVIDESDETDGTDGFLQTTVGGPVCSLPLHWKEDRKNHWKTRREMSVQSEKHSTRGTTAVEGLTQQWATTTTLKQYRKQAAKVERQTTGAMTDQAGEVGDRKQTKRRQTVSKDKTPKG